MSDATGTLHDLLANHPFFAGMPRSAIGTIEAFAAIAEHPAGSLLARTGDAAARFHAVVDGRVAIELAAAGREPLVVATAHAGDVVGWSWFVEPHRWRFDVLALDDVRTIAVDAAALRAACEADHDLGYHVAYRLARVIAGRLEATRHQLMDVYGNPG